MSWAFALLVVAFLVAMLVTDAEIQFTLGMTTYAVSPFFAVALALVAVGYVAITVCVWRHFRGRR